MLPGHKCYTHYSPCYDRPSGYQSRLITNAVWLPKPSSSKSRLGTHAVCLRRPSGYKSRLVTTQRLYYKEAIKTIRHLFLYQPVISQHDALCGSNESAICVWNRYWIPSSSPLSFLHTCEAWPRKRKAQLSQPRLCQAGSMKRSKT